ncbi:MAG: hypothetical protein AAGF12_17515 [Myxococcota bacterium]
MSCSPAVVSLLPWEAARRLQVTLSQAPLIRFELQRRWFLLGLVAAIASCRASEGPVFVPRDGATDAFECTPPPTTIEGNDANLTHECGFECDTDWCSCDPCDTQDGPGILLGGGRYEAMIEGGASGRIRYVFEVRDDQSGDTIFQETVSYDGLFEHRFRFTAPEGCRPISIRVRQLDPLCSRIYETVIAPAS